MYMPAHEAAKVKEEIPSSQQYAFKRNYDSFETVLYRLVLIASYFRNQTKKG